MTASIQNELGRINISDGVIAKVAGIAATDCMGVLGLAASDGIADMLKRDSLDKGVRTYTEQDSVKINLSVIVKYGVSIAAVAENIISTVTYAVENLTGIKVSGVDVVVRGIKVL